MIKTVQISPQDTSVVYAGAFGWGVFRSTDGGATWINRQNGLTNTYVRSIVVLSDSLVFCGTNDGVYKSTNAGALWTLSQATPFSVRALGHDPATGKLFAGTYGAGMYRSTDLGGSWSPLTINDPLSSETLSHLWSIGIFGADSLYAGGSILDISAGGALFQSTDAGATWAQVQKTIGIRSSVRSIAISPNTPATSLIIGTANKGVYKSTNGGFNWTQINAETTPGPLPDPQINAVAFSTSFRFAGSDSLGGFYSRSLGDTADGWASGSGLPGTTAVVSSIDFNRLNENELFLGTEGSGTYRSTNAGTGWSPSNSGMLGTYARSIAINGNGNILLGSNFGDGIWTSTNQGTVWSRSTALGTVNSITGFAVTSNPLIVYAGAYGSGVYRSTDGGTTWDTTSSTSLNLFIRTLVADPTNANVVYAGTGNGVYKTTNGGAGWGPVNTGIPPSTSVRSMAMDPANPGVVYAGSDLLFIFRTTNGGASWTNYTDANGFAPLDDYIRSITVDYANSNIVYAGVDNGRIYKSTDGGASWVLKSQLAATHSVRSVVIHPNQHNIFFAATFGDGIFVSIDSGTNWATMNSALSDLEISALESDHASTPTLYAGSASHGVYRMSYSFVNSAPVLGPIGTKSVFMNQPLIVNIAATDPDGTIPALSATGLPPGSAFGDSLNGHGLFSWTPVPADLGDYTVTFHASDGSLIDSEAVLIHVLDPGAASIAGLEVEPGWNLVSVPVVPADYRRGVIFPTATSQAYAYEGSYTTQDTLSNGPGYWLKFAAPESLLIGGGTVSTETLDVRNGWNIVGSVAQTLPVSSLVPQPPVGLTSAVYGYSSSGGYFFADSIHPGSGYWVKVNQAGQMILGSGPAAAPAAARTRTGADERQPAGSLVFTDEQGMTRKLLLFASPPPVDEFSELPPAPPGGVLDVRVQTTQGESVYLGDGSPVGDIPLRISTGGGIVALAWEIPDSAIQLELEIGPPGTVRGVSLQGSGSVLLTMDGGTTVGRLRPRASGTSNGTVPATLALGQNWPNPFNPSTTISFDLPSAAHVRLTIYDVLGRVVAEPVNGFQEAGSHSVTWTADGVGSGVYFYRIETAGTDNTPAPGVITKKMLFLR